MQTTGRTEYEDLTGAIENKFNTSLHPFSLFDLENQKVVELNPFPYQKLQANNQATTLVAHACDTHTPSIFEWNEDFEVALQYLKPYPNYTLIRDNSTLLVEMLSEIENLLENEYDWDEIDYREPTHEDINYAKVILTEFVNIISCEGYLLTKPYISNSEDGGAKLEWHSDKRSLYLRIDRLESEATTMEDNPDRTTTIVDKPFSPQSYLSLWKWIINE